MFDLIGLENKISRHEAELLYKKKVTRKLMEEVFTSPPPSARPAAVKLKASRYVQGLKAACGSSLLLGSPEQSLPPADPRQSIKMRKAVFLKIFWM